MRTMPIAKKMASSPLTFSAQTMIQMHRPAVAVRTRPIAASDPTSSRGRKRRREVTHETAHRIRTAVLGSGGAHEAAADDDAVGARRGRRGRLLGGRDAEAEGDRDARRRPRGGEQVGEALALGGAL